MNLLFVKIFICIITFKSTFSTIHDFFNNSKDLQSYHMLAKKISYLARKSARFEHPRVAIFMKNSPHVDDLTAVIVHRLSKSLISNYITNKELKSEFVGRPCNYNIFIYYQGDAKQFISLVETKKYHYSPWKLTSNGVLIIMDDFNEDRIKPGFELLFERKMINLVILGLETFNAYSYNPFKRGVQKHEFLATKFSDLYPDLMKNLMGKEFIVAQYSEPPKSIITKRGEIRGVDGLMMQEVFRKMNATYKVYDVTQSYRYSEIYKALSNGTANITFNNFLYLARDYSNSSTEIVYSAEIGSMNLIVPDQSLYKNLSLFEPFKSNSLIILILSMILFSIIWNRFKNYFDFNETFIDTFFQTLEISLRIPITRVITEIPERCLVITYICAIFIIMSYYQTILICIISKPLPNAEISLSEINDSQSFSIIIPSNFEVSSDLKNYYLKNIINNNVSSKNLTIWDLDQIEPIQNVGYIAPFEAGRAFVRSSLNVIQGKRPYKLINDGLLFSVMAYQTERNCIYVKSITKLVQRIREANLFVHYWTISLFEARKLQSEPLKAKFEIIYEQNNSITFNSLKSAFYFVIFGYLIAFFVFLVEIIMHYIRKRFM